MYNYGILALLALGAYLVANPSKTPQDGIDYSDSTADGNEKEIVPNNCEPNSTECADDEFNLPDSTIIPDVACPDDLYQCNDGNCIDLTYLCDGNNDCEDASDELGCQSENEELTDPFENDTDVEKIIDSTDQSTSVKCGPGFTCPIDNMCLPQELRCDGIAHCPDDMDEVDCNNETCDSNYFRCDAGICIPIEHYCNGVIDCTDGSDEVHCPWNPTDELTNYGSDVVTSTVEPIESLTTAIVEDDRSSEHSTETSYPPVDNRATEDSFSLGDQFDDCWETITSFFKSLLEKFQDSIEFTCVFIILLIVSITLSFTVYQVCCGKKKLKVIVLV